MTYLQVRLGEYVGQRDGTILFWYETEALALDHVEIMPEKHAPYEMIDCVEVEAVPHRMRTVEEMLWNPCKVEESEEKSESTHEVLDELEQLEEVPRSFPDQCAHTERRWRCGNRAY